MAEKNTDSLDSKKGMNREILRLAIPNILSNISVPLLGMADTALMGRMESEVYLSAIALGGILFSFIYWSFGFIRMGTTGLTAQAFGAENWSESLSVLARSLIVVSVVAVLLLVFKGPLGDFGFWLIEGEASGGNKQAVLGLGREYFDIRIWAAPASLLLLALHGWFLGMQNARYPMYLTILVNICNISLNFWFVLGLDMKSDGVAWATVIAQYIGLFVGIGLFMYQYRHLWVHFEQKAIGEWKALKNFFAVNTDIFIRTILLVFSLAFLNTKSFAIDSITLAVNSILLQYFYTLSYAVDGFAFAAESLTGRFVGAKKPKELKISIKLLFYWGGGLGILFAILYAIAGDGLLWIFTNQLPIVEAARPFLWWIVGLAIVCPYAFIWDGIYIGATASRPMRNTMILAALGVFLPVYYLSIGSMGNHGLWLAMLLFMAARGLFLSLTAPKHIWNLAR